MRKTKEKHKKCDHDEIRICNGTGDCLYIGDFTSVPYDDRLIKEKSLLFFNDPEPCFIHRSSIISRLCLELEDRLREHTQNKDKSISIAELPAEIKVLIPFGDRAEKLLLRWIQSGNE